MKDKLKNWSLHVPKYFRYSLGAFISCTLYITFGFVELMGSSPLSSIIFFAFAFWMYQQARSEYIAKIQSMLIDDLWEIVKKHKMTMIRSKIDIHPLYIEIEDWFKTQSKTGKDKKYYGEVQQEKKPDINIGGPAGSH